MLNALVADLAAIGGHDIVTTADYRWPLALPRRVDVVTIRPHAAPLPDHLVSSADAVWLIAPETDGCLEKLTARIEATGRMLLGSASVAIRRAADKERLPRRLARCGVAHPRTRLLRRGVDPREIARLLGYPVVVKPDRGAGCCGVSLVRNARELATKLAQGFGPAKGRPLLQQYVRGVPASVSLLCDGRRAVALAINAQAIRAGAAFSYAGGCTPLDHPLAERAIAAAIRTCEQFPGLRGYVGVDLVLTEADAIVIEINPRVTTAYLGVRSAIRPGDGNIAAMAIDACRGTLPAPPRIARRVRFTAAGRLARI